MITLTDTIRLRAGDLDADFAPGHGMVATSALVIMSLLHDLVMATVDDPINVVNRARFSTIYTRQNFMIQKQKAPSH